MLIFAVIVLAILGTDDAFVPVSVRNNAVAVERKDLNSIQYDADLYPQTQARTTISEGEDEFDIKCADEHMYVFGNNIHFRHINFKITADTLDEYCRKMLRTEKVKYINIFALNTAFIDDDIQEKFDIITVIAPKWEILGERTIDLSGENGESTNPLPVHSKDGNPGKPGRNFFGIGEDFSGGENLNIYSKGGDGSPGENGKKGEKGRDGDSATKPSQGYACKWQVCEKPGGNINNFKCKTIKCTDYSGMVQNFYCTYEMYGEPGKPGRNGENGGDGGVGGSPGDIVLFELKGITSGITQSQKPGSSGLGGKGGVGGEGGKTGNGIEVDCGYATESWSLNKNIPSNERAASGKRGDDGKRVQAPNQATPISILFKAKTINKYKSFLRASLNDPSTNHFLMDFLNRLENNPGVKSAYDILGLIDEMKTLEEQFHILYRDVNFYPFYKSLLDRISEYASIVDNKDDKIVLAYLYTAALGRANNLEDDLESNLISDITAYLDIVIKDIEKLREWQNSKIKEDIANKYKQNYKAEIDKKIKDANNLISKEIIPEIYKIETEIDNQINKLTTEVIELQKQSIKNTTLLLEKKRQLQNELVLQGIFGCLKIFGTVVGFMGPVGKVAGSVIDIGSGLAETLILDLPNASDSAPKNLNQISKDITSLKDQINEFGKQKASDLENKLDIVSEEAGKLPVLKELSAEARRMKATITTIKKDKITIKEVEDYEIQFKKTLQKHDVEVKENANDPKYKNAVAVIDHLQNVVKLGEVMADTYVKYKKREGQLTEIDKAIQENEAKFVKLKEYEDEIYNTMMPMMENMEKKLDNIINHINDKSKVVLDVTRWKVKSTLKDMMSHLKKVTEGYKVRDSLVRCIDKLQDGMDALMNVQDHIEDYQSDQTLANFIAGVSSISLNDLDVYFNGMLHPDVREALEHLEIIIMVSVIMQRHRVAIDAFKQYVFPFAHMYFKDSLLPSHLELDDDMNTDVEVVLYKAITQIDDIKSKLDEYKATINKIDKCSGEGEFNSQHISTAPFFVWKNKNNSEVILRLLSGEEVIVKADITQSHESYDAIKFNSIEFSFTANDATVLSEINKILQEFKVTGTHLGDSYYRYQDNTYLISTGDLTIWYSFEKNDKGVPTHKNDAYIKMKEGDFFLSPYATWKIKLDHLGGSKKYSFESLKRYKEAVDLMLEGYGHYILRGEKSCLDLEVNQYYKTIDELHTDNSTVEDFVPLYPY